MATDDATNAGLCGPPRDPKREEQSRKLWELTREERVAAMYRGDLTLGQCLEWAARRPNEVPLIGNEFAFIAIKTPEYADAPASRSLTRDGRGIDI